MGSRRVLVVDDDRDLCDLLSDFLSEEGYDVTRAYAGQDAIDSARASTPDAVLLDLLLPDVSGVAVGRALRDAPSTRDVPIVIISGDRGALARSTLELRVIAPARCPALRSLAARTRQKRCWARRARRAARPAPPRG